MSRVFVWPPADLEALRRMPWGRWTTFALAVLIPLMVAAFGGMVIALGSTQLTLILVGLISGLLLLFVPTVAVIYSLLAMSLFGVGVLMYYARIGQAHWLLHGLAFALWLKLPIDALGTRSRRIKTPLLPLSCCLVAWFALALVSTVANGTPMFYALVGARNYFFVWSIAFAVAGGALNEKQLRICFLMLLVIAVLQFPFAVQQHFVNFGSGASWDSVVGTMGGDPEGGGGSGPMALFAAFAMGLASAQWKQGQLSARNTLLVLGLATSSLMLAEVKAFFIFAPLMMGTVLLREFRRRPAWAMGMLVLTVLLLGLTFTYYRFTYFNASVARQDASAGDYLDYAISGDVKLTNNINKHTGEVSRIGAPLIWLKDGAVGGWHARWIGYGMRASRSSPALGKGDAAKRFPFSLTTSAVTAVLWDLGALGLAIIVSLLLISLVTAWRLSRQTSIPPFHRATLEALAGAFVLALASLPYNDALVDQHTLQIFYAFAIGYVMFWQRQVMRHQLLEPGGAR